MNGFDFSARCKLSILVGLSVIVTIVMAPAFADQIVKPTSGGTIDVGFATDPATPTPGGQTNLNISFINKSTHSNQQHIDYKISVMEGSNQICGTSVLHTAEGAISFPCQLPDAATYQVIVEVDGILFQPIPPETATITVNLGGEAAPSNNSGQGPSNNSTQTPPPPPSQSMVIPSWIKKTAGWWASGQVGDQDFVKGIEWLISNNIIVLSQ